MHTQRPCVNKERYPFVLHLSSERQNWGPVHSCSHCAVSGHHQAGPIPKACTGRPAHSLTSGLHRRWSFPFYDFFFFLNLLPLVLYHSIYFCLCNSQSVFLPLSSLFLLPWRGPQVVVTRERMMNSSTIEPADSLAAGPSPCSLHPLLTSSLFFFFLLTSPLPSFQSGSTIEWGSWGTLTCAEESHNERRHITTIFRLLISSGCHSLLISWMKITLDAIQKYSILCLSFLGCKKQHSSFIFK